MCVVTVPLKRAKLAARERRYFEDLRTTQIVVVTITSNMFWGQTHKKTQYIGSNLVKIRETRTRSLLKGVTWRALATLTTILIAWAITGNITIALEIGAFEVVAKIIVYYLHERAWQQVTVGIEQES